MRRTRSDEHPRTAGVTRPVWESRAFRVTGACLLALNVVLLAGLLALRSGEAYSPLWDGWIGNLVMVAPIVACVVRSILGGPRRAAAAWLAMGMLCWAVGNVVFVGWTQFQVAPPVPSPADVAYLGFYVCAAAAMFCLARGERGSLARSMWLDGALGAAGAATVLAAVLNPVFSAPAGELNLVLVGAAYTVADLVLAAMICGLLAVRGLRGGSIWLWLAAGLVVFCAADVVYALQVSSSTYAIGTILSVLWTSGITVLALALWRPERPRAIEAGHSTAILALPTLATLSAVVVLVISSFAHLAPPVIALATLTLLLAAARTFMSFRQTQRLSVVHHQALTDDLTGLGNRRHLFEHGERKLLAAGGTDRLALLMIDLDNFKEVNDTLGHHTGDELLREIARRLAEQVGGSDLLVRLGGDEFAVVTTLAPDDDGHLFAGQLLDRLSRPLKMEGARLRLDASIGVAESDSSDVRISELLRRADMAMYAAKTIRSRVRLYDPQLDEANRSRLATVRDLDTAFECRQFVLHYQPKVDVRTGVASRAEALVRWQHPTRGLLYPDEFLPVIEQNGEMGALTQIVLETAVRQLAAWSEVGLDITVSVNLSASDLLDEQLADRIAGLLTEHGVSVESLELEITESVLMTDPPRARKVLERLRWSGLRIAVDDYGTGYSALAYLRDLAVDELKIDRSFVDCITTDRRSAAIVRSTIELAHSLDIEVVAEGVEHGDILNALMEFGCDYAQGYYYSRAIPADQFAAWARARAPSPSNSTLAA